jgi:hypothetical protein
MLIQLALHVGEIDAEPVADSAHGRPDLFGGHAVHDHGLLNFGNQLSLLARLQSGEANLNERIIDSAFGHQETIGASWQERSSDNPGPRRKANAGGRTLRP